MGKQPSYATVPLKGLCHHMDNFFRSIKLKQYFLYMRQWFLNFLVRILRKILKTKILIASMKTLTNSETCTISRIKILLRLTISVIGQFSPRYHLLLDRGKVGLNTHVTGGFLNATASSLKRVTGRIFKISKCFYRSK